MSDWIKNNLSLYNTLILTRVQVFVCNDRIIRDSEKSSSDSLDNLIRDSEKDFLESS